MVDEGLIRDAAIASAIVLVTFLAAVFLVDVEEATGTFAFLAGLGGVGCVLFGAWFFSIPK